MYRHVMGCVRGRERRRLSAKFPILRVVFEVGLHERLVAACGTRDDFAFATGRALFRHSACIWGPVGHEDASLNDYIFGTRHWDCDGGRWVVSRHAVAGLLLEIMTNLKDGETRVRRSPSRSSQAPCWRERDDDA